MADGVIGAAPPTRIYQRGATDCLRAAIATVVGCSYEETPNIDPGEMRLRVPRPDAARAAASMPFFQRWSKWAEKRGLAMCIHPRFAPTWRRQWIAVIETQKFGGDRAHALVMEHDEVAHDPSPIGWPLDELTGADIAFAITFDEPGHVESRRRVHRDELMPIGAYAVVPTPEQLRGQVKPGYLKAPEEAPCTR